MVKILEPIYGLITESCKTIVRDHARSQVRMVLSIDGEGMQQLWMIRGCNTDWCEVFRGCTRRLGSQSRVMLEELVRVKLRVPHFL